jgi:CheY-like chemotaxis protein/AraC-like DNA-binding protein
MAVVTPRRPVILTVDDDDGVRETLRIVLEPEYEVAEATSGRAALDYLARSAVDLMLLDVRMSGMDGLEVLRHLREAGRRVPVILLTGIADVRMAVEAMKLGAHDYLTKPFDLEPLRARVRAAIPDEPARGARPAIALIGGAAGVRAAMAVVLGGAADVISAPAPDGARADRPVQLVVVDVSGETAPDAIADVRNAFPGARIVAVNVRPADRVRVAVEAAACVPCGAPLGDVLPAVMDQLARVTPGARMPALRPHVLRVVEYASANYAVGSLAALGRMVGASPRHLLRVFREDVGMGLKEYMNRVRVEVAKPLLAAGEKLEAVAHELGVSSGAQFSRLFQRHTGGRPGSYRAGRG